MSTFIARRRQILSFIRKQLASGAQAPSLDEIAFACGLKSRSAALKHVRALEAAGELMVTPGKARSTRPMPRKIPSARLVQFFEISPQDVANLDDSSLRELVARLCMAGLAEAELPPRTVTWGGDQRAPDGGIDVRVQLPRGTVPPACIPRVMTGFQVKATRMGSGEIRSEMCPNGILRPSIQELIRANGSYVIATSDNAADGEYKKRVGAMSAAAGLEAGETAAHLDYYDARRLADWTNQHPGVVAWVRSQVGRPLQGWQPHGHWADTRGGKPQPFIFDEKLRLTDPQELDRKLSLSEGLIQLRSLLRNGSNSIRLTGLSGVGKTRLAQALFEDDGTTEPLPPHLAVYTDTSQSPNPPPMAVLDELLANGRRAILIVDNCAASLHDVLTARCKSSNKVSLLTIEYDIREHLPNETKVFNLGTGSSELVEKVIAQQFPHISQVSARTITKFAEGNSRVAIALANTMARNESIAGVTDQQLFDRLFWLGKEVQPDLMTAAQVCALVYSFEGEDLTGELAHIAALAGQTVPTLYRNIAELKNRGLAQGRGVWRAVLPHAIANTLAKRALESIPYQLIDKLLVQDRERLLQSFSRRLGYLHESPVAVSIVRKWLAVGELLGDLADLTPQLVDVMNNVAPVDPRMMLETIGRAVDGPDAAKLLDPNNGVRRHIISMLRSIAYEPEFFARCLNLLLKFALAEKPTDRNEKTRDLLTSLFQIYLSGTHASIEQRISWIRDAIRSANTQIQAIGTACLSAALECVHISSHYEFEFGARARNYGSSPRGPEMKSWFARFIDLAVELGSSEAQQASEIRDLLARQFRSLWTLAGMADSLEPLTIVFLDAGWEKGWLAIRQTLRFDGDRLASTDRDRLVALGERAKPKTLVGRVKSIVLSSQSSGVDFADGEDVTTAYEHADRRARELGELVARDPEAFETILPLVVVNEQGRQWMFGEGLAIGTHSITDCWKALVDAYDLTPEDRRNVQVLRGFLRSLFARERSTFEHFLDDCMDHTSLAKWVPVLQLSAPLDDRGCARLLASMDRPNVPAWVFSQLSLGRATQHLSDATLAQLLQRLSIKPAGLEVAIDVLSMNIFDNLLPAGPKVIKLARSLLESVHVIQPNPGMDRALKSLVDYFLKGKDGQPAARNMLLAIRERLQNYTISKYDLTQTLQALFRVQPEAALDILVGDDHAAGKLSIRRRELAGGRQSSAVSEVSIDALLAWCAKGSSERWARVAPLLPAFKSGGTQGEVHWSDNVLILLKQSPEPIEVAKALAPIIPPTGWGGSLAEATKQRFPLIEQLAQALGPEHEDQIAVWRNELIRMVERETRRELEEHRAQDERFE